MTQPHVLELAKQGDPQAIAALMNQSLQPRGMTARVEREGSLLEVVLEADRIPNREALSTFVQKGISNLGVESIQAVRIIGQQTGASFPAWMHELDLGPARFDADAQSAAPLEAQPAVAIDPTPEVGMSLASESDLPESDLPESALPESALPDAEIPEPVVEPLGAIAPSVSALSIADEDALVETLPDLEDSAMADLRPDPEQQTLEAQLADLWAEQPQGRLEEPEALERSLESSPISEEEFQDLFAELQPSADLPEALPDRDVDLIEDLFSEEVDTTPADELPDFFTAGSPVYSADLFPDAPPEDALPEDATPKFDLFSETEPSTTELPTTELSAEVGMTIETELPPPAVNQAFNGEFQTVTDDLFTEDLQGITEEPIEYVFGVEPVATAEPLQEPVQLIANPDLSEETLQDLFGEEPIENRDAVSPVPPISLEEQLDRLWAEESADPSFYLEEEPLLEFPEDRADDLSDLFRDESASESPAFSANSLFPVYDSTLGDLSLEALDDPTFLDEPTEESALPGEWEAIALSEADLDADPDADLDADAPEINLPNFDGPSVAAFAALDERPDGSLDGSLDGLLDGSEDSPDALFAEFNPDLPLELPLDFLDESLPQSSLADDWTDSEFALPPDLLELPPEELPSNELPPLELPPDELRLGELPPDDLPDDEAIGLDAPAAGWPDLSARTDWDSPGDLANDRGDGRREDIFTQEDFNEAIGDRSWQPDFADLEAALLNETRSADESALVGETSAPVGETSELSQAQLEAQIEEFDRNPPEASGDDEYDESLAQADPAPAREGGGLSWLVTLVLLGLSGLVAGILGYTLWSQMAAPPSVSPSPASPSSPPASPPSP